MLISPIFRAQIEGKDLVVGAEKEMLGKQKGNQEKVVSWQQCRESGRKMELSSMLNDSERSHKMRAKK